MDAFATFGNAFALVIAGGAARLYPVAQGLAFGLAVLGVIQIGLSSALGQGGLFSQGIRFVIAGMVSLLAIQHAQEIGEMVMQSAVQYGLLAGGSGQSASAFLSSPDRIMQMGYAKAHDVFAMAKAACDAATLGCWGTLDTYVPLSITGWALLFTYWLVAFLVLSAAILFKVAVNAAVILLPCCFFQPTAQIGWGTVRATIHIGVQLMVLALITSINGLVSSYLIVHADAVPGLAAVTPLLIGTLIFAGLVLGASKLAMTLTSGAMVQAGSLLGAPAGMAAAAARGAAGRLDAPATAATKTLGKTALAGASAGGRALASLRATANRSSTPGSTP